MLKSLASVRLNPDVVDTEIDDQETALLHLGTKTYFSLNVTGGRIWRYLKEGVSLEEICERLQVEFDVDREQAERSVRRLADELVDERLAQRV